MVLGDRTPARVPEEAWWKLGDIRGMSRRPRRGAGGGGLARAHCGRDQPAPPDRAVGPRAHGHLAAAAPATRDELRRIRGVDGRHLAQGRAAEILEAVQRGLALPPEQIRMPTEGREAPAPAAAVAVCSGLVRQIADDLDFDQGLLATRADIAQLLVRRAQPARCRVAPHHRRCDPLRRLIAGEVATAFDRRGPSRARGALRPGGAAAGPPADPGAR